MWLWNLVSLWVKNIYPIILWGKSSQENTWADTKEYKTLEKSLSNERNYFYLIQNNLKNDKKDW
jgi:hypothetical protein